MRSIRTAALAAALALAPAAALAETRSYELHAFNAVSFATGIVTTITIGPQQSVSVDSDDPALFDRLKLRVRNGVLEGYLEFNALESIFGGGVLAVLRGERHLVTVNITVPALIGAEATSGATIEADAMQGETLRLEASSGAHLLVNSVDGARLEAEASSGASLTVAGGACQVLDATASSGASLDTDGLDCETVYADASSGASLRARATMSADIDASSGASVRVSGDPTGTRVNTSSGGSVHLD